MGARANTKTEEGGRAKPEGKAVGPAQPSEHPPSAPFFPTPQTESQLQSPTHTAWEINGDCALIYFWGLMCGTGVKN